MIKDKFTSSNRSTKQVHLQPDFVVVGGGLSGVCAAISTARSGLQVVLVQDRPVLGGNSSSEVRLWSLGATSHMGNNNRWSREGGLINEILLENLKRNKEGNPLIFDTVLLEKVYEEKNITLLLNTSVYEVSKGKDDEIKSVTGFCSQNNTTYHLEAPLFCDASGDGIVSFLSGASFRMGAEGKEEFDEGFAPNIEDYGELLGHSLYFYSKDVGQPINYTPPSFAIKNAEDLPRIKNYKVGDQGCNFWWVEYGGRLDTIHDSEDIKFELWKVVYGIWDYIKNSGKFPESKNLTLEWVGTIPGKRESRRFEGDFMLTQKDIVHQRDFYDAVTHGGWAMDLHPADGVYSKHSSCTQWHSKGVYQIPYRCYYSKDIKNLFFAGRIISTSHVAFGSTRVMLTCAIGGQVVGEAAALCIQNNWMPRDVSDEKNIKTLQLALNRKGQSIPRIHIPDHQDLAQKAKVKSSSSLQFNGFEPNEKWKNLKFSIAQLLPLEAKTLYEFYFEVEALEETSLEIQLKIAIEKRNFTPEKTICSQTFSLKRGIQQITFKSDVALAQKQYAFVALMKNEKVNVRISDERCSGIMTVQNSFNKAVSNFGKQVPPEDIGIDSFEFWTPERRPKGENLAFKMLPALPVFEIENCFKQDVRPNSNGESNVWVADKSDVNPTIELLWEEKTKVQHIKLFFDCDYDHALENNLMQHPEDEIPFVVGDYSIEDDKGNVLKTIQHNFQAINEIKFENPIETQKLTFKFQKKHAHIPVSVFKIAVF